MSDFLQGKLDNQEIRQKLSEHKYASGFKPTKQLRKVKMYQKKRIIRYNLKEDLK